MARPLPKHRAREYETIFIMHPESPSTAIDKVAERCTEVVNRLDGKLLKAENWGRRRLAYPVKKNSKGIYIYVRYLGYQDMVHELERNLRMLDPVIKYLTVKVDEDVDPAARPVNPEDISFMPRYEDDDHVEPSRTESAPAAEVARPAEPEGDDEEPEDEETDDEEPEDVETDDEEPEDVESEDDQ